MTDATKDNMLNAEGSNPEKSDMDFSTMSDEDLMKMDISDIFLEDLDSFLAEKEVRVSRREMMEARAHEMNSEREAENAKADLPKAVESEDAEADAAVKAEPEGVETAPADTAAEENDTAETEAKSTEADAAETDAAETAEAESTEADAAEADAAETAEAESTEADAAEADAAETAEAESTEADAAETNAAETAEAESTEADAAETDAAETAEAESTEAAEGAEEVRQEETVRPAEDTVPSAVVQPAAAAPQLTQEPPPSAPPSGDEPKKKPGVAGLIFVGALLCCAVIAIAAAYFYYADYFSKRFYPGTVINDRNVSVLDPATVKQDIANDIVTYHLDIKELNNDKETITSEDIGLAYVDDGAVDKILNEQDTRIWFIRIFGTKTYEVSTGTTYDREKAAEVINGLNCLKPENITPPQDAQLVDNGTSFSIQPEVEGNQLDEEKFRTMVYAALDAGETEIDIVKDDCYLHPSIRSDNENLNTRMNEYNSILGVNVYYVFGENTEYVNADVLRQFITDDGNHVTLSDDYARKIVYGWGQKYDTFGLAREFTTHSGEVVYIPEGGDYGWVINKDVTIADVQDAVTTQAAGERTPTFLYSAMGWDNGDITGTYVEVSISEQKLWCYHNYELVMETDVVTGLPTSERETRRGIYAIDAKKENATLGRLDVQGYASPVSFWAPFDGGRGLHDAPWRGAFGGSIYQYDGSHGCVNIPEENMEAIYNAIEIGNAVIVY